jgi:small ligand-binding sensory domain FIST
VTRVGAGLALGPATVDAAADAAAQALEELGSSSVDLAFLFLTSQHLERAADAAALVGQALGPRCLLGCAAEGVIGREREVESGAAIAVWAASLPGAGLEPFHLSTLEDGGALAPGTLQSGANPGLIALLVDPFTFPAGPFLARLDDDYPGVPVVGGIATGGGQPGAQALVLDGEVHDRGAVGVALTGVAVETVVSQGCTPLGREAVITRAERNVVLELAGKPALERLREIVSALSPRERALAARGLLAGLVIDENKAEYERGDFLMRGILGADEESGAIALGDEVRVGQTLRFHARDAASADEDLRLTLEQRLGPLSSQPAGALLFTCNGRGTNMFSEPDHDSRVVSSVLARPALAGFFCGGEIGPVGGRSFLHGFTATMAVFLGEEPAVGRTA